MLRSPLVVVAPIALALGGSARLPVEAGKATVPARVTSAEDSTIALGPGDTVRLINRMVSDGGMSRTPGRRLDIVYATRIPASDQAARLAQADRAAEYFGAQAIDLGARRLSIGICDTDACVQRRAPPAAWHLYERSSKGWRRVP